MVDFGDKPEKEPWKTATLMNNGYSLASDACTPHGLARLSKQQRGKSTKNTVKKSGTDIYLILCFFLFLLSTRGGQPAAPQW